MEVKLKYQLKRKSSRKMDRKKFLKKGLLGTGFFVTSAALGNIIQNNIDELQRLEIIGFNHIKKYKFKTNGKHNSS